MSERDLTKMSAIDLINGFAVTRYVAAQVPTLCSREREQAEADTYKSELLRRLALAESLQQAPAIVQRGGESQLGARCPKCGGHKLIVPIDWSGDQFARTCADCGSNYDPQSLAEFAQFFPSPAPAPDAPGLSREEPKGEGR